MPRQKLVAGLILTFALGIGNAAWAGNYKGFQLSTLDPDVTIAHSIHTLADLGATIVRFPVYLDYGDMNHWLPKLQAAANVCASRNVILVICLFPHYQPGSPTPASADVPVAFWTAVATNFANWGGHVRYDLCNEPNHPQWSSIALSAARAIRARDSRHAIVYAAFGTTTATAPTIVPLPGISNQVIEFHFYDWAGDVQFFNPNLPFQPYEVPYPSPNRTQDDLRARLQRVADAGKRCGVPVYIGEVAIPRWHPNAGRFLRDFTSICDDLGIDLTVHAFREAEVWDYENFHVTNPAILPPAKPTVWPVLTDWLSR